MPSFGTDRISTHQQMLLSLSKASEVSEVVSLVETDTNYNVFAETDFPDANFLERWLSNHGVNTFGWGIGKAKPIATLFTEISSRQSVLVKNSETGLIRRYVRVIRVNVKQTMGKGKHRYLIEGSQEIEATGQIRFRNMLL